MQPLLDGSRDIAPANVGFDRVIRDVPQAREPPLIDGDRECEGLRGVANDEHGVFSFVLPLHDAVEVDERHTAPHRFTQSDVIGMLGIASAVPVPQQAVVADGIVVRPRLTFSHGYGGDA